MTEAAAPFVEFFYFHAGGGHWSAATALKQVVAERFPAWRVELVDLQEVLSSVDPVVLLTETLKFTNKYRSANKFRSEDVYNAMLKRGWTYGSTALLRGLQKGIRALSPVMENLLRRHWQHECPNLVVSLIPNFNRVMFRALRRDHPVVPYVTVMTDIADVPPHFWLERQDQFIICGSSRARRQARAAGYRPERIFQASGMILRPDFYRCEQKDPGKERARLGLDPHLPTALIMFGGNGATISAKIVKYMSQAGMPMQSIVLCGRNKKLRKKLSKYQSCCVVGFTDDVPNYMQIADFFIGKPGPGSLSEALHMGLPVIVERNRATLPQERYNTKWVEKRKIGIVVKHFRRKETLRAIQSLLRESTLERFRANIRQHDNRAVFEIPDILEQIMSVRPAGSLPLSMPHLAFGPA